MDSNLEVIDSNGTELLGILIIRVSLEQKEKLGNHSTPSFCLGENRLTWVEVQGAGHQVHGMFYCPVASLLTADLWFHFATPLDILCM